MVTRGLYRSAAAMPPLHFVTRGHAARGLPARHGRACGSGGMAAALHRSSPTTSLYRSAAAMPPLHFAPRGHAARGCRAAWPRVRERRHGRRTPLLVADNIVVSEGRGPAPPAFFSPRPFPPGGGPAAWGG